MKDLIVLPAARSDLREIWDYTAGRWGEAQADRYIAGLSDVFHKLAQGSANSRPAENIRTGLRRILVRQHIVFFQESESAVDIVRILHQSMDPSRWIE